MADIDITELRRLLEKATAGPWQMNDDYERTVSLDMSIISCSKSIGVAYMIEDREDLDLIVALRNAGPALLDRLEAAERERDELALRLAVNMGLDSAWPLSEVLRRLLDAADHLLHDHSCDAHGYEGLTAACVVGRRYLAQLDADEPTVAPSRCPKGHRQLWLGTAWEPCRTCARESLNDARKPYHPDCFACAMQDSVNEERGTTGIGDASTKPSTR